MPALDVILYHLARTPHAAIYAPHLAPAPLVVRTVPPIVPQRAYIVQPRPGRGMPLKAART